MTIDQNNKAVSLPRHETFATSHFDLPGKSLLQYIEEQVLATPDAVAIRYNGISLSYSELNSKSNVIAHYLQTFDVKPNTIIGICLERSFEMSIGLLAILKAGAAYLPLDPTYPQKRLASILTDSGITIVLSMKQYSRLFNDTPMNVINLDSPFLQDSSIQDTSNPSLSLQPDTYCYVIYTSGSTGTPKGVITSHQAIANRLEWMQQTYKLTAHDRVLQKTPYSFDVSVWELFWPLMFGGTLVFAKPEGHKDTEYLLDLVEQEHITLLHFVPSMLKLFLTGQRLERMHSVRDVFCSGEALTYDLQEEFFRKINCRLHNLYGPTEASIDVTSWECTSSPTRTTVPIGRPITNMKAYILDADLKPVAHGTHGSLYISGIGLAVGYLNNSKLTNERFIPNPFSTEKEYSRLYRTGDVCIHQEDGSIAYCGREDSQVKIRGFRIEIDEVEIAIKQDPSVSECKVIPRLDHAADTILEAFIVEKKRGLFSTSLIRSHLVSLIPEYMIPSRFRVLDAFPLTIHGKIDIQSLSHMLPIPAPASRNYIKPSKPREILLEKIWKEILDRDAIGIHDNFFELGGNSFSALRMIGMLSVHHAIDIAITKVFEFPTIFSLSGYLDESDTDLASFKKITQRAIMQRKRFTTSQSNPEPIAIIGMAGRFPGAKNISEFWNNLCNGVDSISHFTLEELSPGIDEALKNDPQYVKARGIIDDADLFDAAFFGISPHEAKVMDPQQRIFLELAVHALEHAGYSPHSYDGLIGVYAGVGDNYYYPINLLSNPQFLAMVGDLVREYGNEKDYIATRISYALNLHGPSVSANTGCSTSLLSVDNAYRSLLGYECDMALAGGVDIRVPQKSGFLYQPHGAFSKDGICKPFDSTATGTMFCDGAGIVVLKRLSDAQKNGDTIYGIIIGSAKNNDGSQKVSFLAPSVEGQTNVIAAAQAFAGINPESIGYIEAHGTGTPLGDPIEIEALTKAFRYYTQKTNFCKIGSLKGNIGHPTIASGIAGFIKATLCLYHQKIPGTLHFKSPNPQIDFENSPFRVVDSVTPWVTSTTPRIAGVSSFGFGGTNVHTIIQEAPLTHEQYCTRSIRPVQLILSSAQSQKTIDQYTSLLINHFNTNPDIVLQDAAFTLALGRSVHSYRQFAVCTDTTDAITVLTTKNPSRFNQKQCNEHDPDLIFMFPGQGTLYNHMGFELYTSESEFKKTIDQCCEILLPHLGVDLRNVLYDPQRNSSEHYEQLKDTSLAQPAIFIVEYAVARLLMSWGMQPQAMVGHSVGEFVGACLAGVFSLEDALKIIALRGKLMSSADPGTMLSIRGDTEAVAAILPDTIQLACINSPSLSVVSGPLHEIGTFELIAQAKGFVTKPLHTSHAFHSAMMDHVIEPFFDEVKKISLSAPLIPFVSTVTGTWITPEQACNPMYWARHMREPVQFSNAIKELILKPERLFLEVGPRGTCTALCLQHQKLTSHPLRAYACLSDTIENNLEWKTLLVAVGNAWQHGIAINWQQFYSHQKNYRIPLPVYPFDRKRFWVDPQINKQSTVESIPLTTAQTNSCTKPFAIENQVHNHAPSAKVVQNALPRKQRLVSEIKKILEETSGESITSPDCEHASFLSLGMDSLFLTQIAYQIQTNYGIKLNAGLLMREYPSCNSLAVYLDSLLPSDEADNTEAPSQLSGDSIHLENKPDSLVECAITPSQQGMWLSSQLGEPASCAYNESFTVELKGNADILLIKETLYDLCKRHDSLRSHFSSDGKTMIIEPAISLDIPFFSYDQEQTAMHISPQTFRWDVFIKEEMSKSFDLTHGPLVRATIVKLTHSLLRVIVTLHHCIADGWSLDVLINEFCILYTSKKNKSPVMLTKTKSFSSYAQHVHEREKSLQFIQDQTFWKQFFKDGLSGPSLPSDHPRQESRSYKARRTEYTLSTETTTLLKTMSRNHGNTLFTTIISTLSILLHELSLEKQNTFVIAFPQAEQPSFGVNSLVGNCVNLIPFKAVRPQTTTTFSEYIHSVNTNMLSYLEHQTYSLIHLLQDSSIHSSIPTHTVGVTYTKHFKPDELQCPDCVVDYWFNPKTYDAGELYFNIVESHDTITILCHYNTDLFTLSTIKQWLSLLNNLLTAFAQNPTIPITGIISQFSVKKTLFTPKHFTKKIKNNSHSLTDKEITPWSETEIRLQTLWQSAFKNKNISRDDNFFHIGGHSLLAARLFLDIQKEFGKTINLSVLFEKPTIRQIATLLQEETQLPQTWSSLVAIHPNPNARNLFLIHGAEGNILLYKSLSQYLKDDFSIYGIQSQGLDGITHFNPKFESVANHYMKEIQKLQPQGPYLIAGYCLGGTIALEIGQQLIEQGEKIAFLGMIENYNIKTIQWPLPKHVRFFNTGLNIYYHLRNLCSKNNTSKTAFFSHKFSTELSRFKESLRIHSSRIKNVFNKTSSYIHLDIAHAFDEALMQYTPRSYPGTISLFVPKKRLAGFTDPLHGWSDIAQKGLEIAVIDVHARGSLTEPYVQTLAQQMKEKICSSLKNL